MVISYEVIPFHFGEVIAGRKAAFDHTYLRIGSGRSVPPLASKFPSSPEEFISLLATAQCKLPSLLTNLRNCYQFLTLGSRQTPILRRFFRYFSIITPLVYFSLRCSFYLFFWRGYGQCVEHKQPETSAIQKNQCNF